MEMQKLGSVLTGKGEQTMPDKEKVIKGLEEISDYFFDIYRNDTDSYKCEKAQEYSDAAIDAIALLKKQEQKWISVEDRLPEIRHAVLAYSPFHKNIWAVSMNEHGEWYYWIPSTKKYDPDWEGPITHWMPMPEMPDES